MQDDQPTEEHDPEVQELYDEGVHAIKHPSLDRRFYFTWLVIAVLALMSSVALIASSRVQKDVAESAKMTADTANVKADANTASNEEITKYLKGEQGIAGVPGANGKDGAPGQPGSIPADLPPGPTGPKGSTGASGAAGPAGEAGLEGTAGAPGPAGNAGAAGIPGEIGEQGPKGDKGDKGDPGVNGLAGNKGDPGAVGPTGPQGPAGVSGIANVQTVVATSASNANPGNKNVSVVCPEGTKVLGGGFDTSPTTFQIVTLLSIPSGNGWDVVAAPNGLDPTVSWSAIAYALCGS